MSLFNFWKGKRVFITGATGLLGSWLTQALLGKEALVIALVRDKIPRTYPHLTPWYDQVVRIAGEVENYFLLERILNEYEIDTVFHIAAQTIVPIANNNPISTFKSNIEGTWNLLEACRRNPQVKRILVASSDKAYGTQEKLPYTEEAPLRGIHPYDVSKSCADLITIAYHRSYGLPVSVTRCANLFGGGDLNFNRLVPGTIQAAFQNESPVIRSDGKMIREYFYVKDAVGAYLHLAEQMEAKNVFGESFNFGSDLKLPVAEMARKILKIINKTKLDLTILNQAANEIPEQWLSSEKARRLLDWHPRYSLEEGLAETVEWYRIFFKDRR